MNKKCVAYLSAVNEDDLELIGIVLLEQALKYQDWIASGKLKKDDPMYGIVARWTYKTIGHLL